MLSILNPYDGRIYVIESSALFIEHDSRRQSNGDKVDG
jgi:hypothetical protein